MARALVFVAAATWTASAFVTPANRLSAAPARVAHAPVAAPQMLLGLGRRTAKPLVATNAEAAASEKKSPLAFMSGVDVPLLLYRPAARDARLSDAARRRRGYGPRESRRGDSSVETKAPRASQVLLFLVPRQLRAARAGAASSGGRRGRGAGSANGSREPAG